MKFPESTVSNISRVDRQNGIIRGVKLLGRTSRNNREYTTDAMRGAIGLYEGVKVYLDHQQERKWNDWIGVVESVQLRADGLYGNIRLRKNSPHFEGICEAADEFSDDFGMSHVADGDSHFRNGIEVVESITAVESVDVVLDPATCAGLFESHGTPGFRREIREAFRRLHKPHPWA
jgi:hypothetical protein